MKKTIYKSGVVVTTTEIKPKPINLEQYCEIEGCDLNVYKEKNIDNKYVWTVDLITSSSREWIHVGRGTTQLKAMSDLVDEINKSGVFSLKVILGRKGWIKRNNYK